MNEFDLSVRISANLCYSVHHDGESQGAFGKFIPTWQKGWFSHYEHYSHFDMYKSLLLKGILTFFPHTRGRNCAKRECML